MPVTLSEIGPLGGQSSRGKAPQLFGLKTTDAATDVDGSGYFDQMSSQLTVGDVILRVTVDTAGVPTSAGFHIVMSNTDGVVDVSNADALTITDTD